MIQSNRLISHTIRRNRISLSFKQNLSKNTLRNVDNKIFFHSTVGNDILSKSQTIASCQQQRNLETRVFFSTWNWSNKDTASSSDSEKEGLGNDTKVSSQEEAKYQREVLDNCANLYRSIMPLNEKLRGPLAKHSDRGTSLPFVFLVGNHSSGKSSFINYVLGRKIQTAGVAPTDDCFTVIAPGPNDSDRDGPALIGDPDMGFSNLRQFGPTLIHHTQLKVRQNTQSENFMMVDSPGMIDSPVSEYSTITSEHMDRGYDFQGVVKWFAERADIVLLFFDPSKPGTTGETLKVLLNSLAGMDHKLLIVLNKADQFRKIHDFARAYGSLCWNLSKVIPRKDLPRIYTMCLPNQSITNEQESLGEQSGNGTDAISKSLQDLHQTRDEVVAEVKKAPKRRIDNVITHLNDSVNLLLMHALIVEDTRSKYAKNVRENKMQEILSFVTGIGLTGAGLYLDLPLQFTGGVMSATILGVGGMKWFNDSKLKDTEKQLLTSEELSASFQRTHSREVNDADEFTSSLWQRIKDPLKSSLSSNGLNNIEKVSDSDIAVLNNILDNEIPKLRRLASPTHFGTQNDMTIDK